MEDEIAIVSKARFRINDPFRRELTVWTDENETSIRQVSYDLLQEEADTTAAVSQLFSDTDCNSQHEVGPH